MKILLDRYRSIVDETHTETHPRHRHCALRNPLFTSDYICISSISPPLPTWCLMTVRTRKQLTLFISIFWSLCPVIPLTPHGSSRTRYFILRVTSSHNELVDCCYRKSQWTGKNLYKKTNNKFPTRTNLFQGELSLAVGAEFSCSFLSSWSVQKKKKKKHWKMAWLFGAFFHTSHS